MAPSIWRSKDAQHFQVVHRSQRDPLINDPLASQHVLKQVNRANNAGGSAQGGAATSRADLEAANPDLANQTRPNVGEAALYGIYYDDTSYDYMQHLRPIRGDFHSKRGGQDEEEDVETILINVKPSRQQQKKQQKAQGPITLKEDENAPSAGAKQQLDLPADVLPPDESTLREVDFSRQMDVNPSISGLQPDMDPHLRQALEALDDDAFLTLGQQTSSGAAGEEEQDEQSKGSALMVPGDEDDVDDFFSQVLAGGEVDEDEFGHEDGGDAEDWRALPPGGDEQ
ncbi:Protein ltv1, partial [Tilletia horrida]